MCGVWGGKSGTENSLQVCATKFLAVHHGAGNKPIASSALGNNLGRSNRELFGFFDPDTGQRCRGGSMPFHSKIFII